MKLRRNSYINGPDGKEHYGFYTSVAFGSRDIGLYWGHYLWEQHPRGGVFIRNVDGQLERWEMRRLGDHGPFDTVADAKAAMALAMASRRKELRNTIR